jgi:hypothetical protein
MNRALRRAGLIALAVLLCLIVAASLPPVQLRVARAALSRLEGVEVRLDYLWAGFGGVTVEGLHVAAPGLDASVARADVDIAFWSSLTRLGLDVRQVRVQGVAVRVARQPSDASAAPASRPREPFAGLAQVARVPKWIRVRALSADGNVAVQTATDVDVSAPWRVTLAALGAGQSATLRVDASPETRRGGDLVAASEVSTTAAADVAADGQITRLTLDGSFKPVDREGEVKLAAEADLGAEAERYRIDVDGPKARLVHADAAFVPRVSLDGNVELNVTQGVVAAFARGRSTADVSGTASGSLHADLAQRRAQIKASVRGQGSGWDALDPRLADLGPLDLAVDVDAALDRDNLSVRAAEAIVRSAAQGEVLRVAALQPLRFGLQTWLVEPDTPAEPALRLAVTNLPLDWLQSFVPAARIDGGRLSGELEVVRDGQRTTLIAAQPFKAAGIALGPVSGVKVPVIDVTLVPRATLVGGRLEADVEQLKITARTGLDVEFKGRATTSRDDWPVLGFEGRLGAHVPILDKLIPELHDLDGTARLRFDVRALALLLDRVAVGANADDGRRLFAAELAGVKPLRVQLPQLAIDWDTFEPQTLSLRLDRMPVAWLSPYIPELRFRGGALSADLSAAARVGGGLRLTAATPVTLNNFVVAYRDSVESRPLAATLKPTLVLANAANSLRLEDLRLSGAGGDDIQGEISVEEAGDTGRVAVSISLDGDVKNVARRFGAELGKLTWRQRSEIDLATQKLSVGELEVAITDRDGTPFLRLEALRPFSVTPKPLRFEAAGGSQEILHALVTPLQLERLLPNIFGFDLAGVLPEGEFFGTVDADGRLVLAARDPLTFRDVTVRWGQATLLDRVSMSVVYEVAYGGDGVQARSVDLTATGRDGRMLLHSTTRAIAPLTPDRLVNEAQIHVEANLAPLAEQPILANLPALKAGTLEASLSFQNAAAVISNAAGTPKAPATPKVAATVKAPATKKAVAAKNSPAAQNVSMATLTLSTKLRDAQAEGVGRLPDFDLSVDAVGVLGDHLKVALPVRLSSPEFGSSDLRFDGALQRKPMGRLSFEAALKGERVAMGDIERLLGFVAPKRAPADAPALASSPKLAPFSDEKIAAIAKLRAVRDAMPAWSDLGGNATVAIGKVEFPSFAVEGVSGRLDVTPTRAALSGVRASLLGAGLTAAASVDFDAAKPKPYTLGLNAAVKNLELGRLFTAVAPGAPPTADGRFDFATALTSEGLNPLDLSLSSLGEFRLSGRDGVFRGLAADAGTGSKAARVIGILTFSRELKAVGRLLDGLGEIHFKQAELRLKRTPDKIELSELTIVSPQLKIDATGDLELAPLRPVLLSPLNVAAHLAAAGDIAILFDGMKLLEGEPGQAGYRSVTKPIVIAGSAAAPDTSAFWALLDEGAGNARGSFGVGLRALNSRLEAPRKTAAR